MSSQPRLGIVGGGNMGFAIARGVLAARILAPDEILIVEHDPARHDRLAPLDCPVVASTVDVLAADEILLAVKPQHFAETARRIGRLDRSRVVISIMAGLESSAIRAHLGEAARIVRVMPNTPCQVGEGMTGIALGDGARPGDEALSRDIFGAVGRVAMVPESHMHAVTAVSGSGPAYVYLLAELMTDAARALDLEPAVARLLVEQTIIGAGRMLRESSMEAEALRRVVTTPGGTTAAAVDVMEARGLRETMVDALRAARDRGQQLGDAANTSDAGG
ncbi:MAG: pyrroline-5-carboxylate reductase [Phycisphaerales bacterium]